MCFLNYNYEDHENNSQPLKVTICILFLLIRLVFSFTLGPVVWIYVAETVQQSFVPIATMVNWFSVTAVTTFFPMAKDWVGGNPGYIFLFFAIGTFCIGVINWIVLVETQGKKEFEINKDFEDKWKMFNKK